MYDQLEIEAYRPCFQDAIREIKYTRYMSQRDVELDKTADIGLWKPEEYVLNLVPNARDIPIILLDERSNPDFAQILNEFLESVNMGLVLMGNIVPHNYPAMIVLTTSERLYALDPHFESGINFLKRCLQEDGLKFWTTNGLKEATCLFRQYTISLKGSNAKDCLGLHLHMMKILSLARDRAPDTDFYPRRAIEHARQKQKLEPFDKLVYIWLNIDNVADLRCDPSKYGHLSQRVYEPEYNLNETAQNLIRRRCSLVLRLADELENYAISELTRINNNVMHVLTNVIDDFARKKVKKYMTECEINRKTPKVYFQHLDALRRFDRSKLARI